VNSVLVTQILRFGVVGIAGFVIDGGLLWLFLEFEFNPYMARALSFPMAVVVTWALNRVWTFGDTRDGHRKGHFQRYFAVQMVGTLANYSVYSALIGAFGTEGRTVFLAFALGSFLGAIINFCGARYIAFRT
jgi:putative flippase GtrA